MQRFEHILTWIVKGGFYLLPFIPLIVSPFFLFPYITGKNFTFRILIEIMAAAWLMLLITNPRQYLPSRNVLLVVYTLFIGWIVFTALFGIDVARSFWSNYERMEGLITHLHLFVMVLMAVSVLKTPRDWQPIIILTLLASAFLTFYGFLERIGAIETGTGGERLFATLGNSIYLAEYLMVHVFLIALLLIARSEWHFRVPLALLGLAELYIFFAASTRGALLGSIGGIGVAAIVYVGLSRHEESLVWIRRAIGAFLIAGILVGGVLFMLRENSTLQQFSLTAPAISLYHAFAHPTESTQGARLMIWGMAFEALKVRPFFGWGNENFIIPFARHYNPGMFGNEPWFDRTHNMFLEWFVAGGVAGGVLYLALLASFFLLLAKGYKHAVFSRQEVAILSGLLVAYMIQNAFVFDTIVSYLLFFGLGAYVMVRVSRITHQVSRGKREDDTLTISSMHHDTQNDPRRIAAAFVAVVIMAVFLFVANIRPMMASARLINALQSVGQGKSAEEIVGAFEGVFATGTFGVTEARERLADLLITVATVQGVTPESAPAYLQILNLGIQELEKEIKVHPENVRPMVFLGKLYHLRAAITGSGGDQAIAMYDRLLALAPNYVQGYLGKAEAYLVRGENEQAFAAIDEGLRRVGTQPPAVVVMTESAALAHVLADDFDGALAILREPRVREQDGHLRVLDYDRILNIAKRSMRSGKIAERKAFLEGALALIPEQFQKERADIEELLRITEKDPGSS
ncbi:MAG: O-antigen ligase family protein [Patescibacteria group bacterium]